jgi:hypothetical protein
MSEQTFIFGVTIGMFVFLVGIVFAARARRYSQGYTPSVDAHASGSNNTSSNSSGGHGE